MQTGKEIKIVRRAERRQAQSTPPREGVARAGDSGEGRRDAGAVVAGWVRELRRKKVAEAARGFESLFGRAA